MVDGPHDASPVASAGAAASPAGGVRVRAPADPQARLPGRHSDANLIIAEGEARAGWHPLGRRRARGGAADPRRAGRAGARDARRGAPGRGPGPRR
jgi:hypothetical protein